jgi:hypothetical protein
MIVITCYSILIVLFILFLFIILIAIGVGGYYAYKVIYQSNVNFGDKKSEIIYGIRPSTLPNDPKTMGAYLGLQESGLPYSVDNPYLVMAVGNGVMWVVDKGEDILIGDYLISSDVAGHAMKENGTYATAYIVARVAEPLKWSSETAMINGIKHKLISVFFENFVQNNAQKELEILKKELKDLKERMLKFENKIGVLFTF